MEMIRSFFTRSRRRPPAVSWILEHRAELQGRIASTRGRTPLASLYRMYEYFVAGNITGNITGIRNETEFFFNQPSWALAEIPDPQDPLDWLGSQPHPHKIVIAGNHDLLLDPSLDGRPGNPDAALQRARLEWRGLTYLHDAAAELQCANGRRLRVYGSPRSCRHGNWAFQYPSSEGSSQWSNAIPDGTDILVTHGPPRAHLDTLRLGCTGLLSELWRVRPTLHVFGHVHDGYGEEWLGFDSLQEAYERVVVADGKLWNLLRLFALYLRCRLRPQREARCLLVNPCAVGGLRDEKRRDAIKVLL